MLYIISEKFLINSAEKVIRYITKIDPIIVLRTLPPTISDISMISEFVKCLNNLTIIKVNSIAIILKKRILSRAEEPQDSRMGCGKFKINLFIVVIITKHTASIVVILFSLS